jgi:hypothetical protein
MTKLDDRLAKQRELLLRRTAERFGLALVKSHATDMADPTYGTYGLIDPDMDLWLAHSPPGQPFGLDLNEADEAIAEAVLTYEPLPAQSLALEVWAAWLDVDDTTEGVVAIGRRVGITFEAVDAIVHAHLKFGPWDENHAPEDDHASTQDWDRDATRCRDEIAKVIGEFEARIWYGRTNQHLAEFDEAGDAAGAAALLLNVENSLQKVEDQYEPLGKLGPYSDFEWGVLNGRLSALRWAGGESWSGSWSI